MLEICSGVSVAGRVTGADDSDDAESEGDTDAEPGERLASIGR